MKFEYHLISGFVIFILLWILIPTITITAIIVGLVFVVLPDTDLKFKSHRNFIAHSIIIWVIVFVFNPSVITLAMIQGIAIHCAFDLKFKRSGMTGFYCISFWGYKKMLNGIQSTIWLWCNVIATVLITAWWVLYV